MATPLLASLALMSSALPAAAPLDQLFTNPRIEVPSLSLGAKDGGSSPLLGLPPAADLSQTIPLFIGSAGRKKGWEITPLMPILKPRLVDPKLVHAPADKDTDFKLIVKEVKIAEPK